MKLDPGHEADAFITKLWADIYARVRGMLHPHHREHEPGGKDQIKLRLGELFNVYDSGVTDGQAIVYQASSGHYVPGAAGGGGTGQAFFEMFGSVTVATVPGPTNLTGSTLTITRCFISSDGACTGSVTAGGTVATFSFAAGGGTSDNDSLSVSWSDGASLAAVVATAGTDGTYLTVDVYFEAA